MSNITLAQAKERMQQEYDTLFVAYYADTARIRATYHTNKFADPSALGKYNTQMDAAAITYREAKAALQFYSPKGKY